MSNDSCKSLPMTNACNFVFCKRINKSMRFAIVTPVFNGEKFLDQSILSVVSQAGPFTIRYHVQDGGSKDRTLEILAAWKSRLARDFPVFCEGIEFSFASAPDRGLYEAVNRGFAACAYANADADAMAWIGSDDRFEPGAFATVEEIFRDFPDIDWHDRYQRSWADAVYAATDLCFSTKSHSRRYFRRPICDALYRTRSHVLAAAIMAKGRWRRSEFPDCR